MQTTLSLGDALRLGSAVVPTPHSSHIERCGVGMVYAALGVRSADCNTINLLYPAKVDKIWPCPWCDEGELAGASVVRHPFMIHYLTGEIALEALAQWLDFLFAGAEPSWAEIQTRMQAMTARPRVEEEAELAVRP